MIVVVAIPTKRPLSFGHPHIMFQKTSNLGHEMLSREESTAAGVGLPSDMALMAENLTGLDKNGCSTLPCIYIYIYNW